MREGDEKIAKTDGDCGGWGRKWEERGGDWLRPIYRVFFNILRAIQYNMNVIHVVICSIKHHTFFVIFCCVCK